MDNKYFAVTLLLVTSVLLGSHSAFSQVITGLSKIGGSYQDHLEASVHVDEYENIYIFGSSAGNTLSIDEVNLPLESPKSWKLFLIKLDKNRNFIWYKTFNSSGSLIPLHKQSRVAVDQNQNVYITETFTHSFTIDTLTFESTSSTTNSGHVTFKLDKDGELLWAIDKGGASIRYDKSGYLEIIHFTQNGIYDDQKATNVTWLDTDGNYINSINYDDADYGMEVIKGRDRNGHYFGYRKELPRTYANPDMVELFKLDSIGNLLLSKPLNVTGGLRGSSTFKCNMEKGGYYLICQLTNRTPLDAPNGTHLQTSMLVKLDEQLNVVGTLELGPENNVNGGGDKIDFNIINNNLYIGGSIKFVFDWNYWTSLGQSHYLYPEDDKLIMAKLSPDLSVQWSREIPSRYYSNDLNAPVLHNGELLFFGKNTGFSMDGFDFRPNGGNDIFLLQVSDMDTTDIRIHGHVFYDTDKNGLRTAVDLPIKYSKLVNSAVGGKSVYSRVDGTFDIEGVLGEQTIESAYIPRYWKRSTPSTVDININSIDTVVNNIDFGIYPAEDITDLRTQLIPTSPARPGFKTNYRVELCNDGPTTRDGTIHLMQDKNLSYLSSSIVPDSTVENQLYFYFSLIQPNSCVSVSVTDSVAADVNLVNDHLRLVSTALPLENDTLPKNNTQIVHHLVTGAIDPNDISVTPNCSLTKSFIESGKALEYLIRYENIGTDTAFSITIVDTLSTNLDVNTFEYLSSSHEVEIEQENNILTLVFENILLPHKSIDLENSSGYFKYSIKPTDNLQMGNVISNSAAIFFDFNPPVLTNTVHSNIVDEIDLLDISTTPSTCAGDGEITFSTVCLPGTIQAKISSREYEYWSSNTITGLQPGYHSLSITNDIDTVTIDSVFIELKVQKSTQNIGICSGDSIFLAGGYQSSPGIYADTLQSVLGCDSLVTTQLSINPAYLTEIETSVCKGDSILLAGSYRLLPGIFTDTLQSNAGCDSLVNTTLVINPVYKTENEVTICEGDSIFLAGQYQASEGVYIDAFQSTFGCDSLLYTTLHLLPTHEINLEASICEGDSIFLAGSYRLLPGIFTDTLQSSVGCDSLINTALIVNPVYKTENEVTICEGDSVFLAGQYQSSEGVYTDVFQSTFGCDSLLYTTLHLFPTYEVNLEASICEGDSIFMAGSYQSSAGIFTEAFQSIYGCDSLVHMTLTVTSNFQMEQEISICEGDSIFLADEYRFSEGVYIDTLQSTFGCDSIVKTALSINRINITVNQAGSILTAEAEGNIIYQWGECRDKSFIPIIGESEKEFTAHFSGAYQLEFQDGECIARSDCFEIMITSVSKEESRGIKIYPNPADNFVNIVFEDSHKNISVAILTPAGQLILYKTFSTTDKIKIDLLLESGIYFMDLISEDGDVARFKLIKN